MTGRNRALWIAGLVIALLLAGVGSWYASSHPDGLEWSADRAGFGDTAEDSATADSPLADYTVHGADGRLPGSVAGLVGVAVTLGLAGGLTLVLRRRSTAVEDTAAQDSPTAPARENATAD
jgi:cobalt/nickel transport protein